MEKIQGMSPKITSCIGPLSSSVMKQEFKLANLQVASGDFLDQGRALAGFEVSLKMVVES